MTSSSHAADVPHVTQDFIFGDLSAGENMLAAHKAAGLGLHHLNRTNPALPNAVDPVTITCTVGADLSVASIQIHRTVNGTIPDASSPVFDIHRESVGWDDLNWAYIETWRGTIPPEVAGTLVSYRIAARTVAGDQIWADQDEVSGEPGLYAYVSGDTAPPPWAKGAIIYHVFLDRFSPDPGKTWRDVWSLDDIWGGSLEGLRARLPWLADLGVTCLWLSPIFPSPTHHGYDTTDYFAIEPRLGSMADFTRLVRDIHGAGMRVILDFVANHCSDQHPLFQRALHDPSSPERDLFTFDDDDHYRSFYDVATMPEWALDREPARRYMLKAARFWLGHGVDGYRLDYAMGPSLAFWAAFRQTVKGLETIVPAGPSPDASQPLTIGEITSSAARVLGYQGRLDGALDFLLLQQIRAFFAFDLTGAEEFGCFLERHYAYFSGRMLTFSFLDNHDMNRFLWVVRGDRRRLQLAALLQFMLPSPPIIFYGTEVGLSQLRDLEYPDGTRKLEESRTPMPWDEKQDTALLEFYRRLIRARRAHPELADFGVTHVPTADPGLLCLRVGEQGMVLINRSASVRLWKADGKDARVDVATEDAVQLRDGAVVLPPMSGCVIRRS